MINSDKHDLDKSFQVLYRRDNWINGGFGWIIESINGEYVNIFVYSPLIGSIYTKLPSKLKHLKKGLINIKNNDNKGYLWCLVRHLNPLDKNPQRITKEDKNMINDLDYAGIKLPVSKQIIAKLKEKTIFALMCFVMKMD